MPKDMVTSTLKQDIRSPEAGSLLHTNMLCTRFALGSIQHRWAAAFITRLMTLSPP